MGMISVSLPPCIGCLGFQCYVGWTQSYRSGAAMDSCPGAPSDTTASGCDPMPLTLAMSSAMAVSSEA